MISLDDAREALAAAIGNAAAVDDLVAARVDHGWRFDWSPDSGPVPLGRTSWVVLDDRSVHARRRTETVEQLIDRVRGEG
jgi:hypothetical protein